MTGRDRVAWALALAGLLGVVVAVALHRQAFPVAQIDFQVRQAGAETIARRFLQSQGFAPEGWLTAIGFRTRPEALNYIERQAGLATLNDLARREVSVWYWQIRYFRPLETEEWQVRVDPTGRLVGFWHRLPEDAPGATLPEETAQRLATRFLQEVWGTPLERYRLVESRAEERPRRRDYTFTWERQDFRVAEATYRLVVGLTGDRLGALDEFLKVPEAWLRAQQAEQNRGTVLAGLGSVLYLALIIAMLGVLVQAARSGEAAWRFGLLLGASVAVIGLLAGLNGLPLVLLDYPTTVDLPGYLVQRLTGIVISQIGLGLLVLLAAVSGRHLARLVGLQPLPDQVLSRRGLASRPLVRSLLLGYALAGASLGYVVLFYFLGLRFFGVWSPVEVPYDDIMSTLVPALYPLTVGVSAALAEEFSFRLFAVPALLILFRRLSLPTGFATAGAVLLPAALWASLHSTYPQQPFYIRAVELTVVGAVDGLVFLRYGIWTTVFAHYIYNATVVGALFLLSGNLYLQGSAVLVMGLPLALLLPALGRWRQGARLWTTADLVARPAPTARVRRIPISRPLTLPPALSQPALWGLTALAIGLAVLTGRLAPPGLTDRLRLGLVPTAVPAQAATWLSQIDPLFSPEGWWTVTTFGAADWETAATYLARQQGLATGLQTLLDELTPFGWRQRYFRPLEKEELALRLHPVTGTVLGYQHSLPESAPGARLPRDQAQALAEQVLARLRGEQEPRQLVEAASEERPARTDYRFVFERSDWRVGEATLRFEIGLLGDRLGTYRVFLKVPEAFERALARRTVVEALLDLLRALVVVALLVAALVLFVRRAQAGRLAYGPAARWTAVLSLAFLLSQLNTLPQRLAGLPTTLSPPALVGLVVAMTLGLLVLVGLSGFVLVALARSLWAEAFPPDRTPPPLAWPGLHRRAVAAGGLTAGLVFTVGHLERWALDALARDGLRITAPETLALLSAWLPGVEALLRLVWQGGLFLAGATVLVLGLRRRLPGWGVFLGLTALALLATLTEVKHPATALLESAFTVGRLAIGYWLVRRVLQDLAWGYAIATGLVLLVPATLFFLRQPALFYQLQGLLGLLVIGGVLGAGLARPTPSRRRSEI